MEHVFISYVSENWTEVKKVYDVLKSHCIEVWLENSIRSLLWSITIAEMCGYA